MSAAHRLDAISLPLWGSRLIEASAGTGKTWTIAALYLRLILGHGAEDGLARPLTPAEILVMTFTRAATRELSDRIRSRLLEAAHLFRGEIQSAAVDPFLRELLAAYPGQVERSDAAWRLAMAAESMDDASVHTIDAWCQRMLREHAFDSGCLFDEELDANEGAMLAEASRDYWRQQVYPLHGAALDEVLAVWGSVSKLAVEARQLVGMPWPEEAGCGSLAEAITRLKQQHSVGLAMLKLGWAERAQQMSTWLEQLVANPGGGFEKKKLRPADCTRWLKALADWAEDPLLDVPNISKIGLDRLTPAGLHQALLPGASIELHPHFAAFEELMDALAKLTPMAAGLRQHAAVRIARRLAEIKQQAGSFGFADMLARLDLALDPQRNGVHAERLRAAILARYPVALVDEFQDTSPVQLRIFDRLYRIADNDRASALLLIGDPKQSIYGFRGADIHSYLSARRNTEGRHYMLATNHRSTKPLVAAVNHLFAQAEGRNDAPDEASTPGGAFLYRSSADEDANPLPFVKVEARGRAERFVTSRSGWPAMSLLLDSQLSDATSSRQRFAQRCAQQIVELLNDEGAGFDDPGAGFKRLRPADIAVLVRSGREAEAVRRELRRREVASVYLSDKDSVFTSAEAQDLLHWLRAVAAPLDMQLVRAAWASRTVGMSIAELLLLASDDEALDARSEQLAQLHIVWQTQGVLTMLRRSIHLLELPGRWLAPNDDLAVPQSGESVDGERRLTNLLHLAELLQAASASLDGEQALIRWFAEQLASDSATAGDEQIVRLESDADLVKVITVHKSKGLEYPLVFLPFASSFRPVEKSGTLFVDLVDEAESVDAGQRRIHLAPDSQQIKAADLDRQREDIRLLYVALTRARHAVWVGLAALSDRSGKKCLWHRSAIGHLLGDGQPTIASALPAAIGQRVAGCAEFALLRIAASAEPIACSRLLPRGDLPPLREQAAYAAEFERHWNIGSFSALVRDLPTTALTLVDGNAVRDDESFVSAAADDAAVPPVQAAAPAGTTTDLFAAEPWHLFPRGSVPGNFLHDQLEWLGDEGFALADSADLQQQLLRRCERQGWGHRAQAVLDWLSVLVNTPLPPLDASLAAIARPLPEMEFWFTSDGLAAQAIDALCRRHLLSGRQRPALPRRELNGLLMGFADLVFEHGGRFWVLDYKSNWLGESDAAYSPDALEAAMASHRYDVQAAIYLLALHRLLRSRLGDDYDPARQLGGAIYLFLRGVNGPTRGCHLIGPSIEMLDELDALLIDRPEAAA